MLTVGDTVKYVGPEGFYMNGLWLKPGDTGVVTSEGQPTYHADRNLTVKLFRDASIEITLPAGFWWKI